MTRINNLPTSGGTSISTEHASKEMDLNILLDASSSMSDVHTHVVRAVNGYIRLMRPEEDRRPVAVTVRQFSSQKGLRTTARRPIGSLTFSTADFTPGGMTPLNDAIGGTIDEMEETEDGRLKVLVIVTDGAENCSSRYSVSDVRLKVMKCIARGWHIMFLGVEDNTTAVAKQLGVMPDNAMQFDLQLIETAVTAAGASTRRFALSGQGGFTEDERRSVVLKLTDQRRQ